MILTNEFVVEAPVDRAWGLLDEVESIISCMPGAAYIGRDGDDHKVSIRVKVGAISANFQGTVRFLEKNEAARTTRIRGVGKDLGGKATATATISVKLEPLPSARTKFLVETDLALTGRLAQFGGGVIADIASRLIEQFTQNLHAAVIARSAESGHGIEAHTQGTGEKEPQSPGTNPQRSIWAPYWRSAGSSTPPYWSGFLPWCGGLPPHFLNREIYSP